MTLYASDRIDDAMDMTKSYLTPFDGGRWARLVVIVAFLLIGGGGSSIASNASTSPGQGEYMGDTAMTMPDVSILMVVAGVLAIALLLAISLAAAIMEFVFVESIASDEIHVWRYFRRYTRNGLRLFGFRLVVGLVALIVIGGAVAVLFGDLIANAVAGESITPSAGRLLVSLAVMIPLTLFVVIVAGLVNGFTTEFIVPIMLREDRGVIAAWRRFWPTLSGQWKQYGGYALLQFLLHIATEIAAGIVIGILLTVVVMPFLVVGAVIGVAAVWSGSAVTLGPLFIGGMALLLLVILLMIAVVYVPVKLFHRQYALLVLGDTNDAFDVLGDRRPA